VARPTLSPQQQAQLACLQPFPGHLDRVHRLIEEMAALQGGQETVRSLIRLLDRLRHEAQAVQLTDVGDTLGYMGQLARRGGGLQMRVRGLREGLLSLRENYRATLRLASEPRQPPERPAG